MALRKPPDRHGEEAGLAGDGQAQEEHGRLSSIVEDSFEDGDDGELGKGKGPDDDGVNDGVPFDGLLELVRLQSVFSPPQAVADANAGADAADDEDDEANKGYQVIEAEAAISASVETRSTDEAKYDDDYRQRREKKKLKLARNDLEHWPERACQTYGSGS